MRLTLLEMVQNILSEMDGDEVNSISDTIESVQVADIIRTTYLNLITTIDVPTKYTLFRLDASTTTDRPTHMRVPIEVVKIDFVEYNVRTENDNRDIWRQIPYVTPEEFLRRVNNRDENEDHIDVIEDHSGIELKIRNNHPPVFYTTFDDNYFVFDSYQSDIEATLQSAKTHCYGRTEPVFQMDNDYVPELPTNMVALLLNEAKSTAFMALKQAPNPKAEQWARRARNRAQHTKYKREGVARKNYPLTPWGRK